MRSRIALSPRAARGCRSSLRSWRVRWDTFPSRLALTTCCGKCANHAFTLRWFTDLDAEVIGLLTMEDILEKFVGEIED